MGIFRRSRNSNLVVGIFMLIILSIFLSPNFLPRFVSDIFPEIYSGVPCAWLRRSNDRANHQSLLGRGVSEPFELSVTTGPLPTQPNQIFEVRITIRNNSPGTVPIVYNPTQVIIGDNNTSGLGLLFNVNSLNGLFQRPPDPASFPESDLRLLGPRQSCVHVVEIPAGNILVDPTFASGQAQVRAFYRSTTRGAIVAPQAALATPIYRDQGLWTGFVTSDWVVITAAGTAGQ